MAKKKVKLKLRKSYYFVATEIRGFIELDKVEGYCIYKYSGLKEEPYLSLTYLSNFFYETFKEADRVCSKLCDGETQMVVKVTFKYNKEFDYYYLILESCKESFERNFKFLHERRIVRVQKSTLDKLFDCEFTFI